MWVVCSGKIDPVIENKTRLERQPNRLFGTCVVGTAQAPSLGTNLISVTDTRTPPWRHKLTSLTGSSISWNSCYHHALDGSAHVTHRTQVTAAPRGGVLQGTSTLTRARAAITESVQADRQPPESVPIPSRPRWGSHVGANGGGWQAVYSGVASRSKAFCFMSAGAGPSLPMAPPR